MRTVRIKLTTVTIYKCDIPDELLKSNIPSEFRGLKWADMSVDIRTLVAAQHVLPCNGSGDPGDWCKGCHWDYGHRLESADVMQELE